MNLAILRASEGFFFDRCKPQMKRPWAARALDEVGKQRELSGCGGLGRARRGGLHAGAFGWLFSAGLHLIIGRQDSGVDPCFRQQLLTEQAFVEQDKSNLDVTRSHVPIFRLGREGRPHRVTLELDVSSVQLIFDGCPNNKVAGVDEFSKGHHLDHGFAEEIGHVLESGAVDGLDAAIATENCIPVGRLHLEATEQLPRLDTLCLALSFDSLNKRCATRQVDCRHVGQGVLVGFVVVDFGHGVSPGNHCIISIINWLDVLKKQAIEDVKWCCKYIVDKLLHTRRVNRHPDTSDWASLSLHVILLFLKLAIDLRL